jgi:hypothetical protein
MASLTRWFASCLLAVLWLPACGVDQSAPAPSLSGLVASTTPPAAASSRGAPPANVTVLSDGTAVMVPPVRDVAMLRRMPDGSYKRVCGAPDSELRAVMQDRHDKMEAMRAARGAK